MFKGPAGILDMKYLTCFRYVKCVVGFIHESVSLQYLRACSIC